MVSGYLRVCPDTANIEIMCIYLSPRAVRTERVGAARVQLVAVALQHHDVVVAIGLRLALVLARFHHRRGRLPRGVLTQSQAERQPIQRISAETDIVYEVLAIRSCVRLCVSAIRCVFHLRIMLLAVSTCWMRVSECMLQIVVELFRYACHATETQTHDCLLSTR